MQLHFKDSICSGIIFYFVFSSAFSYVLQQSGFSGDNSVNNCEESSENSSSEVEECNMSDDQRVSNINGKQLTFSISCINWYLNLVTTSIIKKLFLY